MSDKTNLTEAIDHELLTDFVEPARLTNRLGITRRTLDRWNEKGIGRTWRLAPP
jgi:hypothetical protein